MNKYIIGIEIKDDFLSKLLKLLNNFYFFILSLAHYKIIFIFIFSNKVIWDIDHLKLYFFISKIAFEY